MRWSTACPSYILGIQCTCFVHKNQSAITQIPATEFLYKRGGFLFKTLHTLIKPCKTSNAWNKSSTEKQWQEEEHQKIVLSTETSKKMRYGLLCKQTSHKIIRHIQYNKLFYIAFSIIINEVNHEYKNTQFMFEFPCIIS